MGSPKLKDHDVFVIEGVCRAPRAVTLDMPAATAVTSENGMAAQVDDAHRCCLTVVRRSRHAFFRNHSDSGSGSASDLARTVLSRLFSQANFSPNFSSSSRLSLWAAR